MSVDIWSVSPIAVVGLLVLLVVLRRRGRSYGYLACVVGFFLYMMVVARWTVFPLRFDADFIEAFRTQTTLVSGINLVPLAYPSGLPSFSVQIYGNFLLGVPFGFGLPFLVGRRARYYVGAGAIFAASIELLQLAIDLAYGFAYRTIDVNDFLLVWFGAIAGYLLFRGVALAYRKIIGTDIGDQGIWGHAHDVLTS